MVDLVEFEFLVGLLHGLVAAGHHVQGVAVERQQVVEGHAVGRIEVVQVREQVAAGVADAPVGVNEPVQGLVGDADVLLVVGGGHPHAQDLRAELVDDLLRGDDVADGFRHLAPFGVDHVAVGQDGLVGGHVAGAHRGEQGGMEPAAVLVRAFQVQVGRETGLLALLDDRGIAGAGVEPDVQDVGLALPVAAAAFGAGQAGGHDLLHGRLEPVVAAGLVLGVLVADVIDPLGVEPGLVAVLADQRGDGHAPVALARDAPVGPVLDHGVDALLAPGRDPIDVVADRLEGALAQIVLVHADEPLGGGAEDDRLLAAPAVRVGVRNLFRGHEVAELGQLLDDLGVGFPDVQPGEELDLGQELAPVVHGRVDLQAVLEAGLEVLAAVTRGGVHAAGAGVEGDVVGQDHLGDAVKDRVLGLEPFQLGAAEGGQGLGGVPAELGGAGGEQGFGQDVKLALGLDQDVVEVRVHGHAHVVRDGPRGGGPDQDEQLGDVDVLDLLEIRVGHGEADVDGRGAVILVLDLGLGQGGAAVAAPVDGLLAADHAVALHEPAQFAGRGRLVLRLHGHVRVVPDAEHAETLELAALGVQPLGGVGAADLADGQGVEFLVLLLQLLLDLVLDGQAVAVPTGHVLGLLPLHVAGFDHDVLEDLVQGGTHVDVPVGIGRTVVQHVPVFRVPDRDHLVVGLDFLPELERFRLALLEVGLHGEFGLGQEQGVLVIAHGFSSPPGTVYFYR